MLKLFIFFFSFSLYAARIPPKWRFEYGYGQVTSSYLEEQPSILFTRANIKQVSDTHQFIYQYLLIPRWLDISLGANISGTQVQSPEDSSEHFVYTTAFFNLGLNLPLSDYWNIKIVAETFYTTMLVEEDRFGFRNLTGNQVYPEVEWIPFGTTTLLQVSPYFKLPLFTTVSNREETTIGLKIVFPLGGKFAKKFPTFAYQKSIIVKFFYSQLNLNFERSDFIPAKINVRQVGFTLGFNF